MTRLSTRSSPISSRITGATESSIWCVLSRVSATYGFLLSEAGLKGVKRFSSYSAKASTQSCVDLDHVPSAFFAGYLRGVAF